MMQGDGTDRASVKGRGCGRIIASLWVVTLLIFVAYAAASAAPKNLPKAKAGDCAACHGTEKPLPQGHPDTKAMNYDGCKACHPKGGEKTLAGKLPLSHQHQLAGVNCEKCHGKTKKPENVKMKVCVDCHGSPDKLAEKTAQVKPANPHNSPHYGPSADCTLCHHQHKKSEDYCAQCHQFNFKLP
ncbi:MAG: cytochrome c3 family protein, partial [Deltaproteobacteria bacterium]|nr:cytochrome c3 family protein [Deltaproteobacteria bacterium]